MKIIAAAAAAAVAAAGGLIYVQTQPDPVADVAELAAPAVDQTATTAPMGEMTVSETVQPAMAAAAQEVNPQPQGDRDQDAPVIARDGVVDGTDPTASAEEDLPIFVATVGKAQVFVATVMAGMATNFFGAVSGKCRDGSCPLRD